MNKPNIKLPKLIRNPHFQTVLPGLVTSRVQCALQCIHFDIDTIQQFVLACRPVTPPRKKGVMIIVPGIEGNHESPVVKLLLVNPLFKHHIIYTVSHRGIGTPNKQVLPYHAGLIDDLKTAIDFVHQRHPNEPLHAIGFSMGANVLLNYLSKNHGAVDQATAISTPFDIRHTVDNTPTLYQRQILKTIRNRMKNNYATVANIDWSNIHTIRDFDRWVTAPYFGFESADDYYDRTSSIHVIDKITCPTWLISAADDPFVAPDCWPDREKLPANIHLIDTENGGHMGFLYFEKGFQSFTADIIAAQNQWFSLPH